MFRLAIFSVYVLAIVFLFLHLRSSLRGWRYKEPVLAFFFFMVLIPPFTDFLAHFENAPRMSGFLNFGYYVAAYIFYLFFLFLLYDIAIVLNRYLTIIPAHRVRSLSFRGPSLCILLTLPVIIVLMGRENFERLRINEYRIAIPRKSAKIDHLKMAVASDFHLGELTDEQFMSKFVEAINAQKPDLVLLPGDILEGHDNGGTEVYERQFSRIKSTYGTYASFGNHEYHGPSGNLDFFQKANINVLQDSAFIIGDAFCLVGRNDNHVNKRRSLAELLSTVSGSLPIIVLDHRPSGFDDVSRSPVDVEVSGTVKLFV